MPVQHILPHPNTQIISVAALVLDIYPLHNAVGLIQVWELKSSNASVILLQGRDNMFALICYF